MLVCGHPLLIAEQSLHEGAVCTFSSPLLMILYSFRALGNTEVLRVVFLRMLFSVGEGVLKLESFEEASQG